MELNGERTLPISCTKAWAALNDTEVLRACIPGCESILPIDDDRYEVLMKAAVGPVKATFKGQLRITDVTPPHRYTLEFEGNGGAAGMASGTAQVFLTPAGETSTTLRYETTARIGGKLAQLGSRLVDSAARMIADKFFNAFVTHPSVIADTPQDLNTSEQKASSKLTSRLAGIFKRQELTE